MFTLLKKYRERCLNSVLQQAGTLTEKIHTFPERYSFRKWGIPRKCTQMCNVMFFRKFVLFLCKSRAVPPYK